MWSNAHQNPRYIWPASTIAAAALHAGGLWWANAYWHNSRDLPPPPAIAVLAVPDAELPALTPETDTPLASPIDPPDVVADPVAAPPQPATTADPTTAELPEPEAIAPTISPAAQPHSASGQSPQPETSSPSPAPTPPDTIPPPPSPSPSPPSASTPTPTPPSPSPTSSPTPPTSAAPPTNQRSLQTSLALERVPSELRADPPDVFPAAPPNWQQTVIALIKDSACYPKMIPTVAYQQTTFQLTVEVDGSISNIALWQDSNTPTNFDLLQCLNEDDLKAQIPALIPATAGNAPIATDLMLLTIEMSFSE